MTTLEVNFVRLLECVVSPGWRLSLMAVDMPGIHYNLTGKGQITIGELPPVPLLPHTLIINPPGKPFKIEVEDENGSYGALKTVESQSIPIEPGKLRKLVAGEKGPQVVMICGYFQASYAASIDLFSKLPCPIVEQFDAADQLDQKLKSALAELFAQEVGSGAMTTALMKQILITILRRSLTSKDLWVERFSVLSDPQIARAFSDMVARPGAPHSVETLSHTSGLSRSAFMVRFTEAFGSSPMTILRQMRMRRAKVLLAADSLSIDQVANEVGYASRTSFLRTFRKAFDTDPSEYRATARWVPGKKGDR